MSVGGEIRERLARLETQHEAIFKRLESQDEHRQQMDAKIDRLVSVLDQAKGGWRTLAIVSGISGAIGAFIVKAGDIFKFLKSGH